MPLWEREEVQEVSRGVRDPIVRVRNILTAIELPAEISNPLSLCAPNIAAAALTLAV